MNSAHESGEFLGGNAYPESVRNESLEMWVSDGVLFGRYQKDARINLAAAIESIRMRNLLQRGRVMPLLIDITGLKNLDKDARDFLGSGEAMRGVSAGALLVKKSLYARTIANIFFILSKPRVPHKMFENAQRALRWLSLYK